MNNKKTTKSESVNFKPKCAIPAASSCPGASNVDALDVILAQTREDGPRYTAAAFGKYDDPRATEINERAYRRGYMQGYALAVYLAVERAECHREGEIAKPQAKPKVVAAIEKLTKAIADLGRFERKLIHWRYEMPLNERIEAPFPPKPQDQA